MTPEEIEILRSYEQALDKWQKHLSDLENRFLVIDIWQKLKTITNPTRILQSFDDSSPIPSETRDLLANLEETIKKFSPQNLKIQEIKKRITQVDDRDYLVEKEALDIFLQLSEVKALNNSRIKKILYLKRQKDKNAMKEYIIDDCLKGKKE